ncbi:DedA family protein (plasmid) [Cytobacillus spongiae]|uniref:DedA family protein n=1 Tax=Cytobacillus spongiae TaxID=2901381 RepID=UPI001CD49BE2|nr:DedA family protein [Cytobacillus spongiae]MCA1062926.1 DedA family protein [Rossellomorea aquimaris]UII58530.1 DedA family protein [Cytobacillus spongiae]WJV28445.1 DedA family protein [Rossellomorea sp. AcN35-11]
METLLELVDQFGYIAMFLFSWIVFLGLPVPNELAAALAGYLSEWRHFNPYTSFFFMYSGLISYGIFGFLNGSYFGTKIISRFVKGDKSRKLIDNGEYWINKYGPFAISFSYFIPGIRLFMPYIAGASKGISFIKFLLYAIPSSLVWALVYFQIGRYFPSGLQGLLEEMSVKAGIFFSILFLVIIGYSVVFTLKKTSYISKWKKVRYRK